MWTSDFFFFLGAFYYNGLTSRPRGLLKFDDHNIWNFEWVFIELDRDEGEDLVIQLRDWGSHDINLYPGDHAEDVLNSRFLLFV